jgi:hypothetical protein
MEKNKTVSRYSLIIETINHDKYYYDVSKDAFVKMYSVDDAKKLTLQGIDFLTSVKEGPDELAKEYGITDPVARVYISYQFKGEKLLAPVFNNLFWSYVACSYNGKELNLKDQKILEKVRELYFEIADPDSEFSKMVRDNHLRMININQRTRNNIIDLVAHERAIRDNDRVGNTTFNSANEYARDRYGFYQEFLKSMSVYREFRALYLSYCRHKGLQDRMTKKDDTPKKKRIVPPEQLSMFSEGLIQ